MSPSIKLPPRAEHVPLESEIISAILREANKLPYVRIWRNNTGMLRDATGRAVKYGLAVGSSDLIGIVCGRFLALEVKRPAPHGAPLTDDQRRFLRVVVEQGSVGAVVTSVDEAMAIVRAVYEGRR